MTDLVKALISSGQAEDENEANKIVDQMKSAVAFGGEDPEEVLREYNLEPDYVFDLLM